MHDKKVQKGESIDDWILRAPSPLQPVLTKARRMLRAHPASLTETVKWSHPYYSLDNNGLFSLMWHSTHVNLELWHGASLPNPTSLIEGTGKHARHIKLRTGSGLAWTAAEYAIEMTLASQQSSATTLPRQHADIPTSTGAVRCIRFAPSHPGPLLVLVPSIYGPTADVLEYGELFRSQGALVYIIDPFWRTTPGPLQIDRDVATALRRKQELSFDDGLSDLLATIHAGCRHELYNGRTLLLGICFGGRFVLEAAQHASVFALSVWHGGGLAQSLQVSALHTTETTFDFGGADSLIPEAEIEHLRSMLSDHNMHRVRVHAGAGHGFSHLGTIQYDKKAAQAGIEAVCESIRKCTR